MKTVKERLGDLRLQVALSSLGRSGSGYATYRTGREPAKAEEKVEQAARLREVTGRGRSVSLRVPGDVRRADEAEKLGKLLNDKDLEPAAVYADMFVPRKSGVLDHRLMHGTLCSPYAEIRVACINYANKVMELMRKMGCRNVILWIPDGMDSPAQNSLPDMMERILSGLRQIGMKVRKSENMMLDFRPYDPSFCCTAVPDWGTAAWLCRETDPSFRVILDTASLLPGESINSVVTAMLHQKVLGAVRLSDNRLSQGKLPPGTLNSGRLFRFFLNLLEAERAGLLKVSDLPLELDIATRVGDPLENLLQAVENLEMAFARALVVNPEELSEAQNEPDPIRAETILRDAFMTDVRPVLASWREDNGLPEEPLKALRG